MVLDDLNDKQKEAVISTEGPLLVLAGAGSGKTKVLTTKIAYLIHELRVLPQNILAITFTNKAAKEMKSRVIRMIGKIGYEIQISTFHSFGLLIIRENCDRLGYDKNFTILDSDDSLTMIKRILKEMNLDPKIYHPKMIKNKISGAKNELITPMEYEKYARSEIEKVVLEVYQKYEHKLRKSNSFDFDDLLLLPIQLFRDFPAILKEYQEKYRYVLIDEYQDTNQAQYLLTKMISAKYQNICVVGDNDQSIYSFRGANYRNILNFEKDYKNTKIILLEENYRSTKNILEVANSIIQKNELRKDKNLWTTKENGAKIKYYRAENERDESYYVYREIKKLLKQGVSRKEIAVLYRTNAQSRNMEDIFLRDNIPYRVIGSFYFYKRKEIKDLIAYLKLVYNSNDDVSLQRIINVPKRGIGLRTIENLNVTAVLEDKSIYEVITQGKELEFKNMIEKIKEKKEKLTLTELVDYILDVTGIRHELEAEKGVEAEIRLENLEEFKTITRNFEERDGIISLEVFLEEISLVADSEEYKNNDDVITLMTIHSAKGLEFNYVFLIGLEEGLFPHTNSMADKEDIEEERRLCYVAITRAKQQLWLLNAKKRTIYGQDSFNVPSRFLEEANHDYIEDDFVKEEKPKRINRAEMIDKTAEYSVGDHVHHTIFGDGVIVGINDSTISIAFSQEYGVKSLIKGHKAIRKVM